MNVIKQKTIVGVFWNFTEKFFVRFSQFIISILLARLLMPDDFGLIAIVMVFISLSQVFIESGFSRALIQKKNKSDIDYSTVFVVNMVLSLIFYLLLFLSAPYIAKYYSETQLVLLVRILSFYIVINALILVPNVKLQIALEFKKLAKINIISVFVSGSVGLLCAFYGLGIWSLVVQLLMGAFVNLLLFIFFVEWKISLRFSKISLLGLWKFASNLLIAGFVSSLINNIYNLLIGRYFTVKSLGYYQRANSFSAIASDTVTQAIQQVTFPVLASMQDQKELMITAYIRMIKMSAFIIFPIMCLLSVFAEPLIRILLTDVWLPVVPLLQWIVFTRILYPLNALNLNILNATGRSDLFLKVDLSKLPITIIALVITLPLGVKAMVIGQVICAILYYVINTYMPGRLYGYGFVKQVKDLMPFIFGSILLYGVSYVSVSYFDSVYLQILIGSVLGLVSYLAVCYLLKVEELLEVYSLLQDVLKFNSN